MGNVQASRPTVAATSFGNSSKLWPREARLRNLTYASSIYVEMTQTTSHVKNSESFDPISKSMNIRLCTVVAGWWRDE